MTRSESAARAFALYRALLAACDAGQEDDAALAYEACLDFGDRADDATRATLAFAVALLVGGHPAMLDPADVRGERPRSWLYRRLSESASHRIAAKVAAACGADPGPLSGLEDSA